MGGKVRSRRSTMRRRRNLIHIEEDFPLSGIILIVWYKLIPHPRDFIPKFVNEVVIFTILAIIVAQYYYLRNIRNILNNDTCIFRIGGNLSSKKEKKLNK